MKREEKFLKLVNKAGHGIEIGPSYNPVAPKKSGYKVEVIDRMNREQLIAHYQGQRVSVDKIEEVDYVWNGEPYENLIGKNKYYDWIIASHVIEHTPNLIGFLESCNHLLKENGVLSLAVPDSRYCFDRFRQLTSLAQILDAHFQKQTYPSAGSAYEHYLNFVSKGDQVAWGAMTWGKYQFVYSQEKARRAMEQILQEQIYIDLHMWCFTPSSFRLLIYDLYCLDLSPFQECAFFPTAGCEFFITLGRPGTGKPIDRLALLKQIKRELAH